MNIKVLVFPALFQGQLGHTIVKLVNGQTKRLDRTWSFYVLSFQGTRSPWGTQTWSMKSVPICERRHRLDENRDRFILTLRHPTPRGSIRILFRFLCRRYPLCGRGYLECTVANTLGALGRGELVLAEVAMDIAHLFHLRSKQLIRNI